MLSEFETKQIGDWLSDIENVRSLSSEDQIELAKANKEIQDAQIQVEKAGQTIKNIVMRDKHGKWAGIPFLHGVWQQDEVGVEFNHNIIGRKLKCYRIEDKKEVPMELVPKIDDYGNGKMVCPSCGEAAVFNPFRSPVETYPYCPWCGQKLKGEQG